MMTKTPKPVPNELRQAFLACRTHVGFAGLFSLAINLLFLTYPLYMLQVYDRVLASGSKTTLAMLTVAAVLGLATLALLDLMRSRLLARMALRLDEDLAGRILTALTQRVAQGARTLRSQGLRDFDTLRQFITGQGIHALLDAPWVPLYLLVLAILHPWLGLFGLTTVLVLLLLMLATDRVTRGALREANDTAALNYALAETSLAHTDALRAMGMLPGLAARWQQGRDRAVASQSVASERAAAMSSLGRFLRMGAQVGVLGLGALLVLDGQLTAGAMFAATIILGRGLAPVEQLVAAVRQLNGAVVALGRLNAMLIETPPPAPGTALPRPAGALAVEGLVYAFPGTTQPMIKGVAFGLAAGEALALIGPSGAGKTTLARLLIGSLAPSRGHVRLDGADVHAWGEVNLGPFVGYLPQDVQLFVGSVRDNIARFRADATDEAVIAAARLAGAHELILHLPNGYDTRLAPDGDGLSAGQRQRIGLARALFGEPSLIVLDEPTSNLDAEGEQAVGAAIAALKARGATQVIIAHRPNILRAVDKVLVLQDGAVERFGSAREVFAQVLASPPAAVASRAEPAS